MIDLTPQQIKDNAPEGATHYMDDEKGFDYVRINKGYMDVWFSRFSTWLPVGYVVLNDRFKPLP